MKTVSVRDLQKKVKKCVEESQKDRVVITKHGKPAPPLCSSESRAKTGRTLVLQTDASFWKLIRSRRKQETISLEELKDELRR